MNINHSDLVHFSHTSAAEFWKLYEDFHNGREDSFKMTVDSKRKEVYYIEARLYKDISGDKNANREIGRAHV